MKFLSYESTVSPTIWLSVVIIFFPAFTVLVALFALTSLRAAGLVDVSPSIYVLSSSDFATGCLAYAAAVSVAMVALFGVWLQTRNAAVLNRTDKDTELRKEAYLQYAKSSALMCETLIELANPDVSVTKTGLRLQESNAAWHRLCLVASNETVKVTADFSAQWGSAYLDVMFYRMELSDANENLMPANYATLLKFTVDKQIAVMSSLYNAYSQLRKELSPVDQLQLDSMSTSLSTFKVYLAEKFPEPFAAA